MRTKLLKVALLPALLWGGIHSAQAEPGILQFVTRPGFWANDFPDTFIFLQNYINYKADLNTPAGDLDFDQNISLTRMFRPWHFGEENQYQFIQLVAIPYADVNVDHKDFVRGMADPVTFNAIGWNDPEKKHHVQLFNITRFPLGDSDLSTEAFAIMPGLAYEGRWGSWMWDVSTGYWHEFEQRGQNNVKGQDYWEVNSALTYRMESGLSIYTQADYRDTQESEVLGVKQGNAGHNFGVSIGAGYWLSPRLQLDAKYYVDLNSKNESVDNGNMINIRLAYVF